MTKQEEQATSEQGSVIFYVKISEPTPAGVYVSKRNIC